MPLELFESATPKWVKSTESEWSPSHGVDIARIYRAFSPHECLVAGSDTSELKYLLPSFAYAVHLGMERRKQPRRMCVLHEVSM